MRSVRRRLHRSIRAAAQGGALAVSILATTATGAVGGELRISDVLSVRQSPPVERGTLGFAGAPPRPAAVGAFSEFGTVERPGALGGVVGLAGPLGVVLDYGSGLPRMRGFALTQGDHMRLEARGSIAPGFSDVQGSLSVNFRF